MDEDLRLGIRLSLENSGRTQAEDDIRYTQAGQNVESGIVLDPIYCLRGLLRCKTLDIEDLLNICRFIRGTGGGGPEITQGGLLHNVHHLIRRPSPLLNGRNLCYMNSVLQMLYQDGNFRHFLIENKESSSVYIPFKTMLVMMVNNKDNSVLPTHEFYRDIVTTHMHDQFKLGSEHDASELLQKFMEVAPECFGTGDNLLSLTTLQCEDCGVSRDTSNRKWEPVSILPLAIPPFWRCDPSRGRDVGGVIDLLHYSVRPEHTNHSGCLGRFCRGDPLRKRPTLLRTVYTEWPKRLFVSLKRFEDKQKKNQTPIHIPQCIYSYDFICEPMQDPFRYILESVIIHVGETIKGGHYYCYARYREGWFKCNDTSIERVILAQMQDDIDKNAYILAYKRKNLGQN